MIHEALHLIVIVIKEDVVVLVQETVDAIVEEDHDHVVDPVDHVRLDKIDDRLGIVIEIEQRNEKKKDVVNYSENVKDVVYLI